MKDEHLLDDILDFIQSTKAYFRKNPDMIKEDLAWEKWYFQTYFGHGLVEKGYKHIDNLTERIVNVEE